MRSFAFAFALAVAVAFTAVTASLPSLAEAHSRYDQLRVTPWMVKEKGKGKGKGKLKGFHITVALFRESEQQTRVHLGLMPSRETKFDKDAVMNPNHEHWLHRFEDITADQLPVNQWVEIKLSLDYAANPKIRPGQKYQLATTWPTSDAPWKPGTWSHVFGPNWTKGGDGGWGEPELTAPGP